MFFTANPSARNQNRKTFSPKCFYFVQITIKIGGDRSILVKTPVSA